MTNELDVLRKQMKDNQERWKKVEAIVEQLNQLNEVASPENARSRLNTELLLLIVEQLRPAADYGTFNKELNKFQKDVGKLVDNIMKMPRR